jgi:hypothetical protein
VNCLCDPPCAQLGCEEVSHTCFANGKREGSRVEGQYRPGRGHSRDPVLGLALGLDGDSTGRAFDGVCKACGGLSSIVRSYLQSSRRVPPSCFILDPFRPANYVQGSPLHTQEISSQSKALKTAAVGIGDFSGQQRTDTRPTRNPVSPYWKDRMVARAGPR